MRRQWTRFVTLPMAGLFLATLGACPDDAESTDCPDGEVFIGGKCVTSGDTSDADVSDTRSDADTAPDGDGDVASDVTPDTDPGTVTLPFALDDHFVPSGFMGDVTGVDATGTCPKRAGGEAGSCHAFSFTPGTMGWGGVWWQYPENNWGEQPGLVVPAGAKAVTFWAWGKVGGESVTFGSGYASDGFEKSTGPIVLTTTPTEYTLSLAGASYTDIAGAFNWVASSGVTFYIDDLQMTAGAAGAGCTDPKAENYDANATVDDGSCTYDVVQLPFVIDDYYKPSGFMGDGETGAINAEVTCPMRGADGVGDCHGFTFTPGTMGWGGVFWQFPEGNWGEAPGLDVAAGATDVTFWAWGKDGGEKVEFLSGYASDGYEAKSGVLTLSATPTKYTLSLGNAAYTDVAGAFGWVANSGAVTFYVDGIEMNKTVVSGGGCTNAAANNYDANATSDDGSCLFDVTFKVDLSCSGVVVSTPVSISGPFCSWCASGFELADQDGDDVWEGTFAFKAGALEFKYMANGFAVQEDLIGDGACAVVTDNASYANRQVTVSGPATFSDTWGQCSACGATTSSQIDLPVTFDAANVDYTLTDFGDAVTTLVNDPTNAANKVASTLKPTSAPLWAGTTISTPAGLKTAIPFTASNTKMSLRVYSPHAGIKVRLKAEVAGDPTKSVETEATVTTANAWETLTFDFSQQAAGTAALNLGTSYNMVSVFFNFGVDGATAGARTYLWDDVMFVSGGGTTLSKIDLPVTFDSATVDYTVTDFGDAVTTLVADPTNAANKVASTLKPTSAPLWAGTTASTPAGLKSVIPFTASNTKMSLRVYSPHAGIKVRMKAEVAGDPTKSVETEATVTTANAWETLTFDFAQQAAGTAALNLGTSYNMVSVFFNFGVDGATAGARTYLWDDLMFVSGGGVSSSQIDLPITFDVEGIDYTVTDFGDAVTTLVSDPTNAANTVASTLKPTSAPLWAGTTASTTAGLKSVIPFTAQKTRISARVYSPHAGIKVRLKVEVVGDPTKSVETEATVTTANTWETLTFDFSQQAAGTAALNLGYSYNLASIFFNFGVDGATAGARTYLWDDLKFVD